MLPQKPFCQSPEPLAELLEVRGSRHSGPERRDPESSPADVGIQAIPAFEGMAEKVLLQESLQKNFLSLYFTICAGECQKFFPGPSPVGL